MTDKTSKGALPPKSGPDDTADLIRRAGRRPAVPLDEIARIKAATHARWKSKVERGQGRRGARVFAALATAALVVMAVIGWYSTRVGREGASSNTRVQFVAGVASISNSGTTAPRTIVMGDEVPVGAQVTTAEGGRVALLMPTGHSVRIDRASRIRVLASSRIGLEAGGIYVDSGPAVPLESLAIATWAGDVRDVGTQFETRLLQSALRVRVREGSVSIAGGVALHEVSAGSVLELAESGAVTRDDSSPYGPEWDWVADVTPPLDVEGRPLREFLNWIARERGWTLAFEGTRTETRAAAITVDGSIDGLSLEQAMEAVFATCRLTYQAESGVLTISTDDVDAR